MTVVTAFCFLTSIICFSLGRAFVSASDEPEFIPIESLTKNMLQSVATWIHGLGTMDDMTIIQGFIYKFEVHTDSGCAVGYWDTRMDSEQSSATFDQFESKLYIIDNDGTEVAVMYTGEYSSFKHIADDSFNDENHHEYYEGAAYLDAIVVTRYSVVVTNEPEPTPGDGDGGDNGTEPDPGEGTGEGEPDDGGGQPEGTGNGGGNGKPDLSWIWYIIGGVVLTGGIASGGVATWLMVAKRRKAT